MPIHETVHNASYDASATKGSSTKTDQSTQSAWTREPTTRLEDVIKFIKDHGCVKAVTAEGDIIYTDTAFDTSSDQNATSGPQMVHRYLDFVAIYTNRVVEADEKGDDETVDWVKELSKYSSTICAQHNVKNLLSEEDCKHIWSETNTAIDTAFSNAAKLSKKEVYIIPNYDGASKINISGLEKEACKAAYARTTAENQLRAKLISIAESNQTLDGKGIMK